MTQAPALEPASPWRRVAAFAVDYLLIALYIGLLALVMLTFGRPLVAGVAAPWQGHLLGFLTLTLPVVLYFAVSEASASRGTLGKCLLGVAVIRRCDASAPDQAASFGRTLLRAAVKFLPWELSHAALYRIPGWPTDPATPQFWQITLFAASLLLALWYVLSLFVDSGRTPYDRLSGTWASPRKELHHKEVLA